MQQKPQCDVARSEALSKTPLEQLVGTYVVVRTDEEVRRGFGCILESYDGIFVRLRGCVALDGGPPFERESGAVSYSWELVVNPEFYTNCVGWDPDRRPYLIQHLKRAIDASDRVIVQGARYIVRIEALTI